MDHADVIEFTVQKYEYERAVNKTCMFVILHSSDGRVVAFDHNGKRKLRGYWRYYDRRGHPTKTLNAVERMYMHVAIEHPNHTFDPVEPCNVNVRMFPDEQVRIAAGGGEAQLNVDGTWMTLAGVYLDYSDVHKDSNSGDVHGIAVVRKPGTKEYTTHRASVSVPTIMDMFSKWMPSRPQTLA